MSPTSRPTGPKQRSHDGENGEAPELPPSTLAAALINNISNNKPTRKTEQDDLQRLMLEISSLGIDADRLEGDAKLEHQHKLIYVFARAVLERLTKDDPFMNVPQLVLQACEALDVFMSTIKETPEVLNYTLAPDSSIQSRGQEPLWIWLFPRILALLCRKQCEVLMEKIKDFFYVSFQVVSRSPKLWALHTQFFSYLKECASSTLIFLQSPNIISRPRSLELLLPPEETFPKVFMQENDDVSFHCRYILHEATESLWHAANLLSVLSDIMVATTASATALPSFQDYLAWMIDEFFKVHEIQNRWRDILDSDPKVRMSLVVSFCSMNSLLSSLRTSLSGPIVRKSYLILTVLCADLLEDPTDLNEKSIKVVFCSCLLSLLSASKKDDSVSRNVVLHLLPYIQSIQSDEDRLAELGKDFKKTINLFCQFTSNSTESDSTLSIESFENDELNMDVQLLDLAIAASKDSGEGPPSKRRKLVSNSGILDELITKLYSTLASQSVNDLVGLHQIAEACFTSLDDEARCTSLVYLGQIACASSETMEVVRNHETQIITTSCSICDAPTASLSAKSQTVPMDREAIAVLTNIVKSPVFLESRKPRVLAMLALRKFAVHFDEPELLDLEISPLGQWCLQSLQSSIRELRISAGRTLPFFLRKVVDNDVSRRNAVNAFAILRSLSDQDTPHLQETCILAWGQLGRISKDEELNIVLLKLVEYLGHANPITSGAAYNEILSLAKSSDTTTERLLSPFWASIAIIPVKDLLIRPHSSQLMADLLETTVPDFLVLTQAWTLPYLVLTKSLGVIKRIAQARKEETWQICFDTNNHTRILALLLIQNVTDIEGFILSLLRSVSSKYKDLSLADLLRTEPALTALHLLKAAGTADDSKKSRIRVALQLLASNAPLLSPGGHQNKKNTLGLFLEYHILGIVARFSEIINDPREDYPLSEKISCVKAMDEMIKLGKSYTRAARPQICACLQSAMIQKDLYSSSFCAWQTMLMNLNDEDVELMLESTFSTMIQKWDMFDNPTKARAQETLQYLLKSRKKAVLHMIDSLPSLSGIPPLASIEERIQSLRDPSDPTRVFSTFSLRVGHENSGVVYQALVELKAYLRQQQSFLQASAISEQPNAVIGQLVRAVLDSCVRFNESNNELAQISAECLGLVGCLDSNRVESIREQREMVVVSNFQDSSETTDFVLFLLEEVMVKAFLSATDTSLQGFLSFVMQDLLEKCDFRDICAQFLRNGGQEGLDSEIYQKWLALPPAVQQTLTPFLTSKYSVAVMKNADIKYPIFNPKNSRSDKMYNTWLKAFVLDLLQKPLNPNADIIFPPLRRAIRIKDLSVASFLLPYVVLHVVVEGTNTQRQEIGRELLGVLEYQGPTDSNIKKEEIKLCSEAVFRVLDYLSRWIQEKHTALNRSRGQVTPTEDINRVSGVLEMIPAEIISRRAVECKSYARALFHWEQYIRVVRASPEKADQNSMLLERLQDIYTQIDEPDGIEGISAHLHVLNIDQQILGHRKSGRWTAAQSWYEIKLAEEPENVDVQVNLLECLKATGQYDVLLNYVEGMHTDSHSVAKLLPFATEASWSTARWQTLEKYTSMASIATRDDFNVCVGNALLALHKRDSSSFVATVKTLRERIACSLSPSATSSLSSCHDNMLKLHVLTELEMIAGTDQSDRSHVLASLDRRLEVIGAYLDDKQYLLGIRRAAMQLSSLEFTTGDIASAWLTSARLARKGNAIHQSFNAVLHASQLGDDSATIEHARLLWKEGHSRKAIQSLQGAIDNNAFISHNRNVNMTSFTGVDETEQQNLLTARAHLLLAKWLDSAGQTHSLALRAQYQLAAQTHSSWEKGHYYLGRHYNKLLQSEKAMAPELQSQTYLSGETAKLVIENYLRALIYGTKYIYQTLPRILTLWLDLAAQVNQPIDPKYGTSKEFVAKITTGRKEQLASIHSRFSKYVFKMPAYMFYTALPQILSRINHPNTEVFKYLQAMVVKVVQAYPQHALWGLLAVATSMQSDRQIRGAVIIQSIRSKKAEQPGHDMKTLLKMGEQLTNQLLLVCNAGDFQGNKTSFAHITKDLGFNPKNCLPSPLAVPVEKVLTATLPTLTNNIKTHKAFSRDIVTITSFLDEVIVLSSLQKPRKLTARGSDGKKYGLMCKPKDDLRKDQRLMEFNGMINRALKRDAESSRRQLYIKTYAVTPLNEECGIIEWVDGLKTLRDILLSLYRPLGIAPNYREIEVYCEEAIKSESKLPLFSEKVLGNFPPVFHRWFVQQFPEPPAWFAARLRYTRSCAVMSMVGTILGLGDRHGENILFEEGNGGTFHVDFNCLFDKGLTFVKPERVPFRLTHNMVDAMGIYGYEGPFRKSSELTLKLLRQNEETLMTILEAFIYDPTLDLLAKKSEKKRKDGFVVATTAQGVLDTIQRKVRGLLTGESVPLGVEGQADELIKQATNLEFLAGMYIGWCSFF
ncbi:hypothetical protein BP5796_09459 [Coleophoma crateriformis]|uniref:Serine/threonine-protein kinase MEC1 n=1 Tax=Coleophoma crateriformis TaxID=565419 RepID=A0A3D8QYD7_9HELO|nr:hypothetical protein BP5796_09459 [Coleophoma crateriformis]